MVLCFTLWLCGLLIWWRCDWFIIVVMVDLALVGLLVLIVWFVSCGLELDLFDCVRFALCLYMVCRCFLWLS